MRFLLPFVACFSCLAQLPVIPFVTQQSAAAVTPIPQTIAGLKEWWVFSDMPTNTVVSNWVGRINGFIWTNGATARLPTNSATGVHFDGTATQLTNRGDIRIDINTPAFATNTLIWVITPEQTGSFDCLLSDLATSHNWTLNSGSVLQDEATSLGTFAINNTYDWSYKDNAQSGAASWVTNAVLSISGLSHEGAVSDLFIKLGYMDNGGHLKARLREFLWYTNYLTSLQYSNVHYYETNLYHYAP